MQPRKPKGAPGGEGGRYDVTLATTGLTPPPPPDLSGRTMTGVAGPLDFTRTRLEDARWEQVNAVRSRLAGTSMIRLKAFDCNLRESDLTGADLTDAVLFDCRLDCARLDRARLHDADIRRSTLMAVSGRNIRLNGAHITDTRFNKADMTGADLSEATISNTSFYGASMTSVNLRGATLNHCDMSDADIRGLDLSDATVSDLTVSDSTRLDGVTFSRDQMGRIRDSNGRFVGEKTLTERGATVID